MKYKQDKILEASTQFFSPSIKCFCLFWAVLGDYGNEENVKLVESIADLTIAKAAILGNHDAWNTSRFSSR